MTKVASAVADGEAIDWHEVDRRLALLPEARQAAALKLVQSRLLEPGTLSSRGRSYRRWLPSPAQLFTLKALLVVTAFQASGSFLAFLLGQQRTDGVPALPVLLTVLVFGGAGAVLVRAGQADSRALSLAGFFLCVASAASQRFLPLPHPSDFLAVSVLNWALTSLLPETFLPFFLWQFTREFPRTLRLNGWAPFIEVAIWISGTAGLALFCLNALGPLVSPNPTLSTWAPWLRQPASLYWLALSLFCLPAPVVALARCGQADEEESRRVRWFISGLALGIMPLFAEVLAEALSSSFESWMSRPAARQSGAILLYGLLLTLPVTTTYAIVAHRLLRVRLLLQNAARFALARASVAAISSFPTILFLAHLYRQRARPMVAVLTQPPAPALLLFAAAGWILYSLRGAFLNRLERTLLGRREDLQRVLASFGRKTQHARTVVELTQAIRGSLAELVATEHATLLVRDAATSGYISTETGVRPIPGSSSLARMLEASPEPIRLAEEDIGSFFSWLIEDDRHWIADCDAHLAVPLISQGETIGVLVLGAARSGLPYTREDQQAIAAFAIAASLMLERTADRDPQVREDGSTDAPAGECRACGSIFSRAELGCSCGSPLSPAPIPYELAGKFRLETVLGKGGMGIVYRAIDLDLGRRVALKTLPNLGASALLRLRREARSMAGFIHPGLALIFGVETWRGVPVLVVEYLDGGTLADRLRHGSGLPILDALHFIGDLAAALEAMHAKGLLHRDVKPSNIGFTAQGVPKLLDFGLSRLVDEARLDQRMQEPADPLPIDTKLRMTLTGHIVGTPLYLSPEALAGMQPSPAQDLWSLHLVLWEALAGYHPLACIPFETAIRRLAKADVPDIRTARPDCPLDVAEMLTRGLHRKRRHRLLTAAVLRQEILRLIERQG